MANFFIFLTIFTWGIGALLGKIVLKDASSMYTYILEAAGTLTIALLTVLIFKKELVRVITDFNWLGYLFGILWGIGTVTFIVALKYKPASIVVPLTALYPLVTAMFAIIFLKEAITLKIGVGIVLAILATLLLV